MIARTIAKSTPKDDFYISLAEKEISEIDYTHAQRVFNHFYMTHLGDYHNFYLLSDVLLVANMFENFRDVCLQHYGLDPAHNYTSSDLSWQVALNMTDVELDLLTDIDQHLFIEERIRGGVENYDASKRNSYLMYLDANNLYGRVMSQPLPPSNFKWLTDKEMKGLDVMMILDDSSRGYVLVCDLGKYYFYFLYIYVYSKSLMFLFFVFQSTLVIS